MNSEEDTHSSSHENRHHEGSEKTHEKVHEKPKQHEEQAKNHQKEHHKEIKFAPRAWFEAKKWAENPFTFNIYPRLFVGYKDQTNKLLLMLLEKHKFILLTGPTGSGKTTLLQWTSKNMEKGYDSIYLGKPPASPEDLVVIFNEKFGPKWPMSMFRKGLKNIYQIPDFLNRKLKGRHLVVMIDEIHESNIEMLEWLRVFGDQVNNISFLFAGLPVFEDQLMVKLETFRKRIIARIELSSLTKEEADEMIKNRIRNVGGSGTEISEEVMSAIYERTSGFPREMLRLCNDIVNNAIIQGKESLSKDLLDNVEAEKEEERVSLKIVEEFTPMQKEIVEILSQKALSPGQIANELNLEKYKSRQHAVRSVNNILKTLLQQEFVERKQDEKTYTYSLTTKLKSILVKA